MSAVRLRLRLPVQNLFRYIWLLVPLQNPGEWINLQKTPQCHFLFSQHPEPPNCTGDYNDSHHSSIEKRAEIEILLKHHTDIESVKTFFCKLSMIKVITKSRGEPYVVQGVSHRSVFFKLTLADRKMQAKICLKVVLTSLDYGIWVSETSF